MFMNLPVEIDMSKIHDKKKEHMELKFDSNNGCGDVKIDQIIPGVSLFEYNFKAAELVMRNLGEYVLGINHCTLGRVEWEEDRERNFNMGQGDVHICNKSYHKLHIKFPLKQYKGVTILFEEKGFQQFISFLYDEKEGNQEILFRLLNENNGSCVIPAQESLRTLFMEFHNVPKRMFRPHIKMKILTLILYLIHMDDKNQIPKKEYFHESQMNKIKRLREFMVTNLDKHYTLDELSDQFDIPLTAMKHCFKTTYGTSIYDYLKTYRMQKAAAILISTDLSITEVALSVGYYNASKFASAFKKFVGFTPSNYRKKHRISFVVLEKEIQLTSRRRIQ